MSVLNISWMSFTSQVVDTIPPASETFDIPVTLIPDWNSSMYVSWDVPADLDPGNVKGTPVFNIYTCTSEEGPFVRLTPAPLSSNQYFTYWTTQDSKVHEEYFVVEIIYPDVSESYKSLPTYVSNVLPKWQLRRHKDIIRREAILLDRFVGIDSVILIPKTYGLRCPDCYDSYHEKITDDHCETCYGTSYDGGYNTGMVTKLNYTPRDPDRDRTYIGNTETITISAWTIPFPYIPPHATVIRLSDSKVFRVESHRGNTEMMTVTQRQNIVLRELSKDAIENKLLKLRDSFIEIPVRPRTHVHH